MGRGPTALAALALLVACTLAGASPAAAEVITEFPTPAGSSPNSPVTAPDGALWFTESGTDKVARMTTAGVLTNEFPLSPGAQPEGITVGPDGNLWISENGGDKIGRVTPTGTVNEFAIPGVGSRPNSIAPGPDGALWFTEDGGNEIGRITTTGVVTNEFPVPGAGSNPFAITPGPDGNLWFTEEGGNQIGKITIAGGITEFTIPTAGSAPEGIIPGPDGQLWFSERTGQKIGRIPTSATTGAPGITELAVPDDPAIPGPPGVAYLTTDSAGNVWYADFAEEQIGRVSSSGAIKELLVSRSDVDAYGIARGPDGRIWFAEYKGNKIGRVDPDPPSTSQPPAKTTDTQRPDIQSLVASNRVFSVDPRGAIARRKRVPRGTTFRFRLSEAAKVSFVIQRRTRGRRVRGRCRKATRKNRKARRCTRFVSVRTFSRNGVAGANRVPFSGRIRVKGRVRKLRPGRYRAAVTATDAAGNRSLPRRVAFRVVRR